jgi:F-type H+-transporting ATPase subunit alpha
MSKLRSSPIPLFKIKFEEKGRIRDIKEIIVRVSGLPTCLYGQMVDLGDGVNGIIMGFDETEVLVLILGDPGKLRMGKEIKGISEPFSIPVGEGFLGRVVSAMGEPMDQRDAVVTDTRMAIFRESPGITKRTPTAEFMPSGTKIVDMFIPVAKGQRQLILGDRVTGKTAIAVDAILNQRDRNVICIYCAVGKSVSALEKVISALQDAHALTNTIVMAATDNAPVGEQYLIPFAAASMGDYFATRGRDVLVVYDDLTKHAWAYRQLSLLLDRPPGREAYPGDIFYLQTQLMERAGKFSEEYGGGSMTFLGIAETQQGDLTGYIPSNLSSMCDGQIFLSTGLFSEGVRPAVDLNLSLSIIGGRAQPPILRMLSRELRADYARYMEIAKLRKLQTGLSGAAEAAVRKGESITAIVRQGQYAPVTTSEQILLLYGIWKGLIIALNDEQRTRFRNGIFSFAMEQNSVLMESLESLESFTPDVEAALDQLIKAFIAGA